MFGSEAKLAILTQLASTPPELPNEEELMASLREKVGPHADQALLLRHLRTSRGKLHWAVNSYFRDVLSSPLQRGAREDFERRSYAQQQCMQNEQVRSGSTMDSGMATAAAGACSTRSGDHSAAQAGATTSVRDQHCSNKQGIADQQGPCSAIGMEAVMYAPADNSKPASGAPAEPTAATTTGDAVACGSSVTTPYDDDATAAVAATPEDAAVSSVPSLVDGFPVTLLEEVLKHLDLVTLCSVAMTCSSIRKASQSETLWERLFVQRWGHVVFPVGAPPTTTPHLQHVAPHTSAAAAEAALAGALQQAQQQPGRLPPVPSHASSTSTAASIANSTPGQQQQQQQHTIAQPWPPHSTASMGPPPPSAKGRRCGWQGLYRRQHSYQTSMRCPRCGVGRVLPLVYGFPSPALLVGMAAKRLNLGGDHLIEQAYVWACPACRACYKTFPFEDVQLWLQDDEKRLQHQQAANESRGAALAAGAGLPQYTWEL